MASILTTSWSDFGATQEVSWWRRSLAHVHDHVIPHPRNGYHPHLLRARAVALYALLGFILKFALVAGTVFVPANPAFSLAITPENILTVTNSSRAENNVGALKYNTKLAAAAEAKAAALLACQCFQHDLPDGRTPWDFIGTAGYSYLSAGENLAVDFQEAEDVNSAWMASPGHRANILNSDFQELGVGIATGQFSGHQATFVVQMFGRPLVAAKPVVKSEAVQPAPAPTPAPAVTVAPPAPKPLAAVDTSPPVATAPQSGPVVVAAPVEETPAVVVPVDAFELKDVKIEPQGDLLFVSAIAPEQASQVLVRYGSEKSRFMKYDGKTWGVTLSADVLKQGPVEVVAQSMDGRVATARAAEMVADLSGSGFGFQLNPQTGFAAESPFSEQSVSNFYRIGIAAIIAVLVIAALVHRRIHHVSMVANTAFTAALFCLLWLG